MRVIKFSLLSFVLLSLFLVSSTAQAYSVGQKVEVLWKSKWYKSTVISNSGSKTCIHYDGWASSWDECVSASRVRSHGASSVSTFPVGSKVKIKWKSKWWKATVLKKSSSSWYIHYDGFGAKWDEWVGPARIKSR